MELLNLSIEKYEEIEYDAFLMKVHLHVLCQAEELSQWEVGGRAAQSTLTVFQMNGFPMYKVCYYDDLEYNTASNWFTPGLLAYNNQWSFSTNRQSISLVDKLYLLQVL